MEAVRRENIIDTQGSPTRTVGTLTLYDPGSGLVAPWPVVWVYRDHGNATRAGLVMVDGFSIDGNAAALAAFKASGIDGTRYSAEQDHEFEVDA